MYFFVWYLVHQYQNAAPPFTHLPFQAVAASFSQARICLGPLLLAGSPALSPETYRPGEPARRGCMGVWGGRDDWTELEHAEGCSYWNALDLIWKVEGVLNNKWLKMCMLYCFLSFSCVLCHQIMKVNYSQRCFSFLASKAASTPSPSAAEVQAFATHSQCFSHLHWVCGSQGILVWRKNVKLHFSAVSYHIHFSNSCCEFCLNISCVSDIPASSLINKSSSRNLMSQRWCFDEHLEPAAHLPPRLLDCIAWKSSYSANISQDGDWSSQEALKVDYRTFVVGEFGVLQQTQTCWCSKVIVGINMR